VLLHVANAIILVKVVMLQELTVLPVNQQILEQFLETLALAIMVITMMDLMDYVSLVFQLVNGVMEERLMIALNAMVLIIEI
jgi:hypothetical protein